MTIRPNIGQSFCNRLWSGWGALLALLDAFCSSLRSKKLQELRWFGEISAVHQACLVTQCQVPIQGMKMMHLLQDIVAQRKRNSKPETCADSTVLEPMLGAIAAHHALSTPYKSRRLCPPCSAHISLHQSQLSVSDLVHGQAICLRIAT
jgi:hypothetical protein